MKLTLAQHCLLVDVSAEGGVFCVHAYRPAQRLVSLGLAAWEDRKHDSDWLTITDAGRLVLSSDDQPQTDEMQPDKYTGGDFNGVVRGKMP